MIKIIYIFIILVSTILYEHVPIYAASCCGGGGSSSLIIPKFSKAIMSVALAHETYDGYWSKQGEYLADPKDSSLSQSRVRLGIAYRLLDNLQTSLSLPYVYNQSSYTGLQTNSNAVGDSSVGLTYEFFDMITCTYRVNSWRDLKPAVYFSFISIIPTGVSPYDNVKNNFDITGRGFYRFDGRLNIEKTIYPYNMTLSLTYGRHLRRPVNREYGRYIIPYDIRLGDRAQANFSFGYGYNLSKKGTLTLTAIYGYLREGDGTLDGERDSSRTYYKNSLGLSLTYATLTRQQLYTLSYLKTLKVNSWGSNFPATDIVSLEVSYVFR